MSGRPLTDLGDGREVSTELAPAEAEAGSPPVPEHRFVHVSGTPGGSDLWRVHWPAQALMDSGWSNEVVAIGSQTRDLPLERSDVVRIHTNNQVLGLVELVDYVKRQVHKVILDFDDDYTALGDIQPIDGASGKSVWWPHLYSDIAAACTKADAITVATPTLGRVYERWNANVSVVRNYLPRRHVRGDMLASQRPSLVGWQGWIGPGEHMPHRADLAEVKLSGALDGLDMYVVGDTECVRELMAPETGVGGPGRANPEGIPVSMYDHMGYARVAIAPLKEHRFSAGKSWIKPLEYAFQGVPSVVPVWHPAYNELHALGVPLLMHKDFTQMREELDMILSLDDLQWQALSDEVRRTAVFACSMDTIGSESWRQAMWRVLDAVR